jgi:hypothetical protein
VATSLTVGCAKATPSGMIEAATIAANSRVRMDFCLLVSED